MKKTTKIILLALIVASLLTSVCGCNSEHINTNPSEQTKESSSVGQTKNTDTEKVDTSKLTFAKTCDHIDFYYDEDNQWYAYIESWGEYRKLGKIADGIDDAWLGENTVEIVTSQARRGENLVITTLKLFHDSEKIARNTFELDMEYEEGNRLFCNYYQENCAYFFCTFQYESHRLIRFETTDGGKTWMNQENELDISGGTWHAWPEIAKFITKDVGIVSYRVLDNEPLKVRTYVTTDHGKTWTAIADLPDETCNLGNVCDFKKIDGKYIMTVRCYGYDDEYDFYTTDFQSWTLIG